MKYFTLLFLLTVSTLCIIPSRAFADDATPSGSPYDSIMEISKNTTSFIDGLIDSGMEIDKGTAGKLADYLKNSSFWKKMSEKAQTFISKHISKLGPMVKRLGWIVNLVDLAPSLLDTSLSFLQRDKATFIKAFRESTLKVISIAGGLAIGAAVTAALPLMLPAVAAGGVGTILLAAGGAIVSMGVSMLVDKVVKDNLSKGIESFAESVYDSLMFESAFSTILGGEKQGDGKSSSGDVKLDTLQW